jgi:PilZ domain
MENSMNVSESKSHRRSSSRVPACGNVWLQCRRETTDAPNLANGILDISDSGLQFLAKQLLDTGDAVELVLSASGVSGSIRRRGLVRWVVPLGAEACCAGVQFDEPLSSDETHALTSPEPDPIAAGQAGEELF